MKRPDLDGIKAKIDKMIPGLGQYRAGEDVISRVELESAIAETPNLLAWITFLEQELDKQMPELSK